MANQMDTVDMTIMLAAHDAFRRDLERFRDATDGNAFPLGAWNVFTNQLHVHHTSEDELVWPVVRARLVPLTGEVPMLQEMVDEHPRIEPLLAAVEHALEEHARTGRTPSAFAGALDALACSLEAHLAHEERDALPLIAASVSHDEWLQVGQQIQQRMGPDGAAEFFPWLLDGMRSDRARDLLGTLPPALRTVYERVWQPQYARRVGR
jgi:hemerythrin HHE cation binding domain-containing protein